MGKLFKIENKLAIPFEDITAAYVTEKSTLDTSGFWKTTTFVLSHGGFVHIEGDHLQAYIDFYESQQG